MAIEITKEEYEKRFGVSPKVTTQTKPGFIDRTKQAFGEGVGKVKSAFSSVPKNPTQYFEKQLEAGAGIIEAASSPLTAAAAPVIEPTIGKFVQKTANKISDSPKFQNFATSKAGEITERVTKDVNNANTIVGTFYGAKTAPKVGAGVAKTTGKVGRSIDNVSQPIKGVVRDLTPTKDRIVNSNVTKALDLTAGDASTFFQNFGDDVGRFVADNNLIRANKDLTTQAIDDFFKTNYKSVRDEIGKVKTEYKPSQVPRYVESLKAIKQITDDVPGLQKSSVEVDNLLNKKAGITLNDVQRVKELVDDYHKIYTKTGDVKDGVRAQGLNNLRSEIKSFIETEVKNNSGADISKFNKNVAASREILDMVEVRSPRGLTKSNLSLGDFGAFGLGTAITFPVLGPLAPLGGIAGVFVKKAMQAPAVMLRIAKYLDGLSDAQRAKIKADLESGKIPPEFNQFIKTKSGSKGLEGPGAKNKDFSKDIQTVNELKKTVPELHDAVNTEGASIQVWAEADDILKKAVEGKATAKELTRAREIVQSLKMERAGFQTKPVPRTKVE